jgi:class 3 adenylate cyclase
MGGVRQPLTGSYADHDAEFDFPIMADLKAEGATDYVAMPLPFSNGQINVMTMASDHPGGFTTANLGLVFECSAVISRFYEVLTQRTNAEVLLETYLGQRTGARVLGGEIRRGDGDDIEAAILFCDLRHSSRLAEEMPREDYLALLNGFFETTDGLVRSHGGEVLKFIGDAVLAIFPQDGNADRACASAMSAASRIGEAVSDIRVAGGHEQLACAIGASYGRVTYGNVGSADRLDFTVIGAAANVAARLADLGKVIGQPILVTDAIAKVAHGSLISLGRQSLHNVSEAVEVFAPAPVSGRQAQIR